MFMLRKGPYKYVHYVGERPQLFDLKKDPLEKEDLAERPENEKLLTCLYEELKKIADVEALEEESKPETAFGRSRRKRGVSKKF